MAKTKKNLIDFGINKGLMYSFFISGIVLCIFAATYNIRTLWLMAVVYLVAGMAVILSFSNKLTV